MCGGGAIAPLALRLRTQFVGLLPRAAARRLGLRACVFLELLGRALGIYECRTQELVDLLEARS
jgi:hypothetical protein